jgi:hypothetical protein
MMLAIFSTQGRINRTFFDQRAENDTPGSLADEYPGTLYLACRGGARVSAANVEYGARGSIGVSSLASVS